MDGNIVLIEQPHTSRGSLMVGREKQCIPRVYSPRLIGTDAGDNRTVHTIHDVHGFLALVTRLHCHIGYCQAGLPLHADSLHLPRAESGQHDVEIPGHPRASRRPVSSKRILLKWLQPHTVMMLMVKSHISLEDHDQPPYPGQ